jgi:hypothetical protein
LPPSFPVGARSLPHANECVPFSLRVVIAVTFRRLTPERRLEFERCRVDRLDEDAFATHPVTIGRTSGEKRCVGETRRTLSEWTAGSGLRRRGSGMSRSGSRRACPPPASFGHCATLTPNGGLSTAVCHRDIYMCARPVVRKRFTWLEARLLVKGASRNEVIGRTRFKADPLGSVPPSHRERCRTMARPTPSPLTASRVCIDFSPEFRQSIMVQPVPQLLTSQRSLSRVTRLFGSDRGVIGRGWVSDRERLGPVVVGPQHTRYVLGRAARTRELRSPPQAGIGTESRRSQLPA